MTSDPPQRPAATTFTYTGPPSPGTAPKKTVRLCRSSLIRADVQVLPAHGGANNLHSHTGNDGFWFVLNGRVRFYDENDTVVGDLGRHEGMLVPHDTPYWFESAGDEPLELLHVAAGDPRIDDTRVDHRARGHRGPAS
jgi:mannose-6-phosphate isomerase-like protein (cupin superfamily)